MNDFKIKTQITTIKVLTDDTTCTACQILMHYAKKDTFKSSVECYICGQKISNE